MPGVDYSKWDRIELSDDEDTFYEGFDRNLNIRVNRMTRESKDEEIDLRIQRARAAEDHATIADIEANRPLHVGNICNVVEDRTIILSARDEKDYFPEEVSFSTEKFRAFKERHALLLEEFARADWEGSRQLIEDNIDVLLDHNAENVFLLEAFDVELRERGDELLKQYGLKVEILGQIRQLGRSSQRPPRDLVRRYFEKFNSSEAREALQDRVDSQLDRIRQQAALRRRPRAAANDLEASNACGSCGTGLAAPSKPSVGLPAACPAGSARVVAGAAPSNDGKFDGLRKAPLVEAMYSMTPELRRGPGGLDPVEVFESLPPKMQAGFKAGSVEALYEAAEDMTEERFDYHLERCIKSGLWKSG